ncbi:hypothetical protein FRC19_007185 [Serendipita sp. 401]|nr:hypothetical protein FRC19_007185 [Serendipita sp. 401]KAG8837400.1 hypothetical protein FRC18_009354 [Serendipita sp. 400]
MSQSALLGGCEQWGINGLPCFRGAQIDCGWIDENDYEYLGLQDEQERRGAQERRARMAWANTIVAQREQERIKAAMGRRLGGLRSHLVLGPQGNIRFQPARDGLPHHRHHHHDETNADFGIEKPSGVIGSEAVDEMTPNKRKSLALGLDAHNLDQQVGGHLLRENRNVHFGPDQLASNRSKRGSRNVDNEAESSRGHFISEPGTEDTQLNRGVIAVQTFSHRLDGRFHHTPRSQQYSGTEPMVLKSGGDSQDTR